jgi:hypothetical protein
MHGGGAAGTAAAQHAGRLKWALALTATYMVAKVIGGLVTGSLALANAARRLCEADFYIGEFLAHNGKTPDGRQILQTVMANCRPADVVFSAASAELSEMTRTK